MEELLDSWGLNRHLAMLNTYLDTLPVSRKHVNGIFFPRQQCVNPHISPCYLNFSEVLFIIKNT